MPLDVAQLYRRYGDLVLGRCRTLLGDENDAQETAQEIFLRLLRYQDSFRGDASPSTYLFHVTTTTCLNQIRTRRRRREELVDSPPPVPHNDTVLETLQLRQLVDEILKDVDETTRACIVYHCADGMTHEEVGQMVGLSAEAVRKRISNFKSSLKTAPTDWLHASLVEEAA